MIIRSRSYPHPVLSPFTDDVLPNTFAFNAIVDADADNYYMDFEFAYENTTIDKLIDSGTASLCLHLECKRNFYREIFEFSKKSGQLTIAATDIIGHVEISAFVKSLCRIPEYRIPGSHPDYGSECFGIRAGDILAVAESKVFDAFTDYDPLKKVSSILTIQKSDTVEAGPMDLNMEGDRITITLSKTDYKRYTDLKANKKLAPLLANQIVVPTLIEAIHHVKGMQEDDLEGNKANRWVRSVIKKCEDLKIDIRKSDAHAISIAQTLLSYPLRRSLESISMQLDELENQE